MNYHVNSYCKTCGTSHVGDRPLCDPCTDKLRDDLGSDAAMWLPAARSYGPGD